MVGYAIGGLSPMGGAFHHSTNGSARYSSHQGRVGLSRAGIHLACGGATKESHVWGVLFVIPGTEVLAIIGMDHEVSLMILTGWILTMNDAHYDSYIQGVSH